MGMQVQVLSPSYECSVFRNTTLGGVMVTSRVVTPGLLVQFQAEGFAHGLFTERSGA